MLELTLSTALAVQVIVRSISACTTDFSLAAMKPVIKIALLGCHDNRVVGAVAKWLPQDELHDALSLHLP